MPQTFTSTHTFQSNSRKWDQARRTSGGTRRNPPPPNTPTTWCSRMCIQTKQNGKPRPIIYLQPINKHAYRHTYTGKTPFEIVAEIPTNTYRTLVDAWNGYRSVLIREEYRHFATFIMPSGCYRYRTTPKGFVAGQDANNHRFNLITRISSWRSAVWTIW